VTSANSSFPSRLTKVDDLIRGDHSFLDETDECLFYGEYTARRDWSFSTTNKLILNFKKPVERRGREEWHYKQVAIRTVASLLSSSLNTTLGRITLVPIPTSKAKSDPQYDKRIIQTLESIQPPPGTKLDVRELIVQNTTMRAAHDGGDRSIEQLVGAYHIDETKAEPLPTWIILFDDVITTGCHFKAASQVLRRRFPNARITGIFIARRIPEAVNFEILFDNPNL
jgi:hypothetical protein